MPYLFFALLFLSLLGCAKKSSTIEQNFLNANNPATLAMTIVSGNNHTADVSETLAANLVIRVTDSNGAAVSGLQIHWAVSGGNGAALGSATSTTTASGVATNSLTLGSIVGSYTATATIEDSTISATFTETTNSYITNGLRVNYDASLANGGTGPYAVSGCAAGQLTWTDQKNAIPGTLTNFAICDSTVGWNGTGTIVDPYRITFDGITYVDLGTPAVLPTGFTPRTLCAMAKTDQLPGGYSEIMGFGRADHSNAMYIGTANGSLILDGGGYYENTYSPTPFWVIGQWAHACVTYDGTTARLYGNGTLLDTQPQTWNLILDSATIGRDVGANDYWVGSVISVMIYNRALTASEISINCNALASRVQNVTCN